MTIFTQVLNKNDFFIIAEVGVNYYDIANKHKISLINAAKLMIDKAQNSGADAIKFQSYKAENLVSKNAFAYWDIQEEPIKTQYELFKKFDSFGKKEYQELAKYCTTKNLIFLSTPFDFEAVDYLNELVPIFKISSSDLTNLPFIEYVAKKNKPIILSTGAATLGEIDDAINTILSTGNNEIILLHCILEYPTKYEDCNLNMIKFLRKVYPEYLIGFSDHSKPDKNMLVATIAYVYGAKIIEKHFTLDKTIEGNDHYHAMDPHDLKILRENIEFVKKIGGSFYKRPLKSEELSRKHARRSIVARDYIKKGEKITRDKITFKRPATGIPPSMLDLVVDGTALEDINEDEILSFDKIRLKSKK